MEKFGPRNYKMRMGENVSKRHIDQLRYRHSKLTQDPINDDFVNFPLVEQQSTGDPRYLSRVRRPPNRLGY